MVEHPTAGRVAQAVLLIGLLGPLAGAQEPAPAEDQPEAVLKSQGLRKSRGIWVHERETTVLRDLRDARELNARFRFALLQQQQLERSANNPRVLIETLRTRIGFLSQEQAAIAQRVESMGPPVGIPFYDTERNQLVDQQNRYTNEINRLSGQISNIEQQKGQHQEASQVANLELNSAREKFTDSIDQLRKSVDEVTAKYADLAKNEAVSRALTSLGEASKPRQKHKLGPSREMLDAIKQLGAYEKLVKRETVEPDREHGVYHVMAWLNDKGPFRMVFDTGAGITTIPSKIAAQIGLGPRPEDTPIELQVADGKKVMARKVTLPKVKVGKVVVTNVECAVMPEERSDAPALLGQSFIEHVKYTMKAGKLTIERLDAGAGGTVAESANSAGAQIGGTPRAAAKGSRRPLRQTRPPAKMKRPVRGQRPAAAEGAAGEDARPQDDAADAPR